MKFKLDVLRDVLRDSRSSHETRIKRVHVRLPPRISFLALPSFSHFEGSLLSHPPVNSLSLQQTIAKHQRVKVTTVLESTSHSPDYKQLPNPFALEQSIVCCVSMADAGSHGDMEELISQKPQYITSDCHLSNGS